MTERKPVERKPVERTKKKLTLKQWLKKNHPAVLKEWLEVKKEERRAYINQYMREKYYEPSKAKTTPK